MAKIEPSFHFQRTGIVKGKNKALVQGDVNCQCHNTLEYFKAALLRIDLRYLPRRLLLYLGLIMWNYLHKQLRRTNALALRSNPVFRLLLSE